MLTTTPLTATTLYRTVALAFVTLTTLAIPPTAWANSGAPAATATEFDQCLVRLQQQALDEDIPEHIVNNVVAKLQPVERVLVLDKSQPEFSQTLMGYLQKRVTQGRIDRGRLLYSRHRVLLEQLTKRYGVPGQYLIAFWGLETNFGSYLGNMPTLDSLATLACNPRRAEFFTEELITALKLMQRDSLKPSDMRGSWAGAMGHTQFMPSSYLRYAVDGDNDNRINLWLSIEDALSSAANFLQHLGWRAGERWGREVILPRTFPYLQTGLSNSRPLSEWRRLGVKQANAEPLPDEEMQGAILVPMGHQGPAFLAYQNFSVIMGWNRSISYAIAVGHLADRIAGAGTLVSWGSASPEPLRRNLVKAMQRRLNQLGYNAGGADGIIGSGTRAALSAFQQKQGLIADGYPYAETLEALQLDVEPRS